MRFIKNHFVLNFLCVVSAVSSSNAVYATFCDDWKHRWTENLYGYYMDCHKCLSSNPFMKCPVGYACKRPDDYPNVPWCDEASVNGILIETIGKRRCSEGTCPSKNDAHWYLTDNGEDVLDDNGQKIRVYECDAPNGGGSKCVSCPAGTYADRKGSATCTSADPGKCASNGNGKCVTSGAINQTNCPSGKCSSKNNKTCAGRGNSGAAFCIQCPAYETSSEGSAECTRCASGSFPVKVNEGVFCGLCKDKTPDTYYSADERNCVACKKANQYIDGNECKKCPDFNTDLSWSYFANMNDDNSVNNNGIKSCSVKVTTDTGCTIIYNYNGEKYVADATAEQNSAPINYYVFVDKNGIGSCPKCPDDKPSSDGGSGGIEKCYKCGAGHCTTIGDGKTICHKCSAGYSCPLDANGKVQMCDGGFNDKFGVNKCPINTYSLAGASQCIACAGNYTTDVNNYPEKDPDDPTIVPKHNKYCSNDNTKCTSPLACVIKKTNLCHNTLYDLSSQSDGMHLLHGGGKTFILPICEPWPDNINEGKIDRSVIKQ